MSNQLGYQPLIRLTVLVWGLAFLGAQFLAGATIDEQTHLIGYVETIDFATKALNGERPDFETIAINLEFYGLLPVAPAYLVAERFSAWFDVNGPQWFRLFSFLLHLSGWLWAVAGSGAGSNEPDTGLLLA